MAKLIYQDVFNALAKAQTKYVVAGGVAVVFHGYIRFTADLDLIVILEPDNLGRFWDALIKLGYQPRVPVTKEELQDVNLRKLWQEKKNMRVFSFFHKKEPLQVIDMFIQEDVDFKEIYARRKDIIVAGTVIPLISLKDLKILKKIAGRSKDMDDLMQLEQLEE